MVSVGISFVRMGKAYVDGNDASGPKSGNVRGIDTLGN